MIPNDKNCLKQVNDADTLYLHNCELGEALFTQLIEQGIFDIDAGILRHRIG